MAISKINSKSIEDGIISADDLAAGSISTAKIADSAVTAAKITDGAVTNSKITGNVNFKNIIINGDMSIAQRGTSQASITSSGYYTVDRFRTGLDTLGTWTQSQSTDVPSGQGFAKSLKMDCTTADASPGAADLLSVITKFEGQNLQYLKKGTSSAESLTLSFWVKSNKTGTYIANFYDNDNSRLIAKSYTISSADTWEKKEITYAGDTSGALDDDNGNSLELRFILGAGSNYTSGTLATSWESFTAANQAVGQVNLADSTANEWYITGVQLEAGTTASDFEFLPVDVNLQRCQRYFQTITGFVGYGISTTTFQASYSFPTPMRANPSASQSAVLTISDGASNFAQSSTSITTQSAQVGSWFGLFGNFSGLTQFRPYGKTTTDAILFSAEL